MSTKNIEANIIGYNEIVKGESLIGSIKNIEDTTSQVAIDKMIGGFCIDYENVVKNVDMVTDILDDDGSFPLTVTLSKKIKLFVCATEKHARKILNLSNKNNNSILVGDSLH